MLKLTIAFNNLIGICKSK